jgi:hypothetical protein
MSGGISARTPARSKAACRRRARSLGRLSSSPKATYGSIPPWRMWPGSGTVLMMRQRPPSTRSRPQTAASSSGASTPFSSGTMKVSGPRRGLIFGATSDTCQALTPTRTTSTGPTSSGLSVAWAGWMRKFPSGLST